ncbi:hypothetical protein ACIBEA_39080 [Streptomyces sp. NPDC051555]|uniref:hypothetical protein n=1 Tax=Streptomyces sp. NPDC051555 TaxID=3365657 RepID=UPI0037AF1F95
MAEGAYERARHAAAPRVLAFAKLAAARAYGRVGDERAAIAALTASENLIDSIRPGIPDPEWLAYLTHARIAGSPTACTPGATNPSQPTSSAEATWPSPASEPEAAWRAAEWEVIYWPSNPAFTQTSPGALEG